MAQFESFNTTNKKIEKTWNKTNTNLNDTSDLTRQQKISNQNNLNPSIKKIPLIIKREVFTEFNDGSSILGLLPSVEEFTINISESLLTSAKIIRKIYREDLPEGEIPSEIFLEFENYTINNISWKCIDDNTILLQIFFPFLLVTNKSFVDVDLIITTPNIYTALPKGKI